MKLINKGKRKYLKIYLIFILIGVIVGIIYYLNLDDKTINNIVLSIKNNNLSFLPINNITDHLKILSVILLFSLIFIGFPVLIGLVITEGFTFIFRILIYYKIYKFKGLFYALIYYFFNNLVYLYLLYVLFKKIALICKKIYKYKFKDESFKYEEIFSYIFKSLVIIIIIFISDILIYFYGTNVLKLFAFLLK